MLPFLLSIALSSCGVQSWANDNPTHHPYRVPLVATLTRSRASIESNSSSSMADAAHYELLSRGHVVYEGPSIRLRSVAEMKTREGDSRKQPSTAVGVERKEEVPVLEAMAGGRRFDNPVFHARRVWKRSASEDDQVGGEVVEEDANKKKNATGLPGGGGGGGLNNFGLNEIEITVIVVCSALGLLACIVALIFLARYYWKKVHGNNHGYQGVLQRDSSESSMGTTRVDVKEANAKLEEMDTLPTTKETEAMVTRQQPVDNNDEKAFLLPCANGTAVVEHDNGTSENEKNSQPAEGTDKKDDVAISMDAGTIADVSQAENDSTRTTLYSCLGLSQSDCSISSYTANNPSYKYGNQIAYMAGYYGYPCDESFGGEVPVAPISTTPNLPPSVTYNSTTPTESANTSQPETCQTEAKAPKKIQELIIEEAEGLDETSDADNEPASPGFAEAEDVGESGNPNGTDNSASSVFDMDTEHSKVSANNSLIELQEDEDSCRLTEANRAISLPESFSPKEESSESVELVKPIKVEPPVRPEDSGWGDTVKSQFRGSLPVIHLNISPNSNGEFAKRSSSSTSYPVSEAASPNDIEGKPLLSSRALSNLPNTFDNIQMVSELKTERGAILS